MTVLTEVRGPVLLITLNRPEARNAINAELAAALVKALAQLDADPALRVGVLTGAGRGFCAGMDLKAFSTDGVPAALSALVTDGAQKPLIAAVEGFALAGGLELVLMCDLLVAASGSQLGIPEASVGLFAAGLGLFRLSHRVPPALAMEMALTAGPQSAEKCLGLVNRVCAPGQAVEVALQLAERIALNAPLSVAASKKLVRMAVGLTQAEFWELQNDLVTSVFTSDDAREGPRAFAQKRPPVWTGT
ncbi:MAG: crotonase/enoyl-CoA hydratase family protein [Actinomycetota bacterium]|nr:crotonase/enoyl-CoA hydratase family protein [Actinomycetota bacterium]